MWTKWMKMTPQQKTPIKPIVHYYMGILQDTLSFESSVRISCILNEMLLSVSQNDCSFTKDDENTKKNTFFFSNNKFIWWVMIKIVHQTCCVCCISLGTWKFNVFNLILVNVQEWIEAIHFNYHEKYADKIKYCAIALNVSKQNRRNRSDFKRQNGNS